jgi:hypothetical protein
MAIKIQKEPSGSFAKVTGLTVDPIPVNSYVCGATAITGNITISNPDQTVNGDARTLIYQIPYTEFVKADGSIPADALELAADIESQLTEVAPTDTSAGYRGNFNAATDSPDLSADIADYNNGDWLFISEAGSVDLGGGSVDLTVNDQVKLSITYDTDGVTELSRQWNVIKDSSASIAQIEGSAINEFDVVIDADYTGAVSTGSALQPYNDVITGIANTSPGDKVLILGDNVVTQKVNLPHSLSVVFEGGVRYASWDNTNDDVFFHDGDNTSIFRFDNFNVKYGCAGMRIKKPAMLVVNGADISRNGHSGEGMDTTLPSSTTGLLGYDSTQAGLQDFKNGPEINIEGGAIIVEDCPRFIFRDIQAYKNFRGIKTERCGIGGYGTMINCNSTQNIESGYFRVACENITIIASYSSFNANNGLLDAGSMNCEASNIKAWGNWSAAHYNWASANITLRDTAFFNNNISGLNGIGNPADALATIGIADAYNYLGTIINFNPAARFIQKIINTQIHYTGLGSNVKKVGIKLLPSLNGLTANLKNKIDIIDCSFIGQDVDIDYSEVDLTNLHVTTRGNLHQDLGEKAVAQPLAGDYYELPFSNQSTRVLNADFSVDNTGNVLIKEGPTGDTINPYQVNQLEAVAFGTEIRLMLKGSNKIQFQVPVAGCTIDGVAVNSVLNLAVTQLNDLLTNTQGFAGGGDPVVDFVLSGNILTLTLNSGQSFPVDVTTLAVDTNNFVASGALVGFDLVLTMTDSSTVVIDARNMVNGSQLDSLGSGLFFAYPPLNPNEVIGTVMTQEAYNYGPLYYGEPLKKGKELVWNQFHIHPNSWINLGVWAGNTTTYTGSASTQMANWSTKFGFRGDYVTADISSINDTGFSSINTDLVANHSYSTGSQFRLVYGNDDKLRLYIDGILIMTTVTPEDGNDIMLHYYAKNGVALPNFINRSTYVNTDIDWLLSYGADAGDVVDSSSMSSSYYNKQPIELRNQLNKGDEILWNFNKTDQQRIGIWSGVEAETAYNGGVLSSGNWSTCFSFAPGTGKMGAFDSNTNTLSLHTGGYAIANNATVALRFGLDNQLSLYDLSDPSNEVLIGTTLIAQTVDVITLQYGSWANQPLPIVTMRSQYWQIVHDFDESENGIIDGIEDHTVLRSNISILPGDKIMFNLDMAGRTYEFGTSYAGAATGNALAETQLERRFSYLTNEALDFVFDGVSDWNLNTSAQYYFDNGVGVVGYRKGGSGTLQGMFSMRYLETNDIAIWSEDNNELVATAKIPGDGNSLHLYFGAIESIPFSNIPSIYKIESGQGPQPTIDLTPVVNDLVVSADEGSSLNIQIASSQYAVNHWMLLDAPSWVIFTPTNGQLQGQITGTVPAFAGDATDTIVINATASNSSSSRLEEFTITINVQEVAYTNSKSLSFPAGNTTRYLSGNPANVTALQRASDGSGAGDAWSIGVWLKMDTLSTNQTIFYYGSADPATGGRIEIEYITFIDTLGITYGTDSNQVVNIDNANDIADGNWHNVLITYNGGVTGTGDATDFARFKLFYDGQQVTNTTGTGSGFSGAITDGVFRIGRNIDSVNQHIDNGLVNQLAIWDSDQSANISDIFGSGEPQDLSTAVFTGGGKVAPAHYYES